ncbi:hypothetical protein DIE16_17235 [Burkholderia sp. Bp9090]|nr:hypothetical protein DIE16_17235 [Burkholderia sp. Bp9090]
MKANGGRRRGQLGGVGLRRSGASGFGLRASGFGLRASGFGLRASGFRLQASGTCAPVRP